MERCNPKRGESKTGRRLKYIWSLVCFLLALQTAQTQVTTSYWAEFVAENNAKRIAKRLKEIQTFRAQLSIDTLKALAENKVVTGGNGYFDYPVNPNIKIFTDKRTDTLQCFSTQYGELNQVVKCLDIWGPFFMDSVYQLLKSDKSFQMVSVSDFDSIPPLLYEGLLALDSLKSLRFRQCNSSFIPEGFFSKLKHLKNLEIVLCNFLDFPSDICKGGSLMSIMVAGIPLTRIKPNTLLPPLKKLYLRGTSLLYPSDLEGVVLPSTLEYLNLSENVIPTLPDNILDLSFKRTKILEVIVDEYGFKRFPISFLLQPNCHMILEDNHFGLYNTYLWHWTKNIYMYSYRRTPMLPHCTPLINPLSALNEIDCDAIIRRSREEEEKKEEN